MEKKKGNITRGVPHTFYLEKDRELKYFLFVPEGDLSKKKVVVSIHGLSRNADSHFNLNMPFALENDAILVVPYFSSESFQGYNCLGVNPGEKRADKAFLDMLEEVSEILEMEMEKIYLLGYSAGAQFVHRFSMLYPEKIEKLVVQAAGFYTMPNSSKKFPDGCDTSELEDIPAVNLEKFLQIPTYLFVGEEDILRTPNLRQDEFVDSTQGMTRVERGEKWLNTVKNMARERKLETPYGFKTIPKSGHGFEVCMENGLGEKSWNFLNLRQL